MKFWKCAAALMALSVMNATPSRAADVTGRWAANVSSCEGFAGLGTQSPLVVTNYAVRWSGDASAGQPVLVEGSLADVTTLVAHARAQGAAMTATVIVGF